MIRKKQSKHIITDFVAYTNKAENKFSSWIYHYCSPNIVEHILQEDKVSLRFTRSDSMNDTSEGNQANLLFQTSVRHAFEDGYITEEYKDFLVDVEQNAYAYYNENLAGDIFRGIYFQFCYGYKYYLCCFSYDWDSIPLWNYYVKEKSYQGFNIGFDSNKIEKAKIRKDKYEIWVSTVVYTDFFENCSSLIKKYSTYFAMSNNLEKAALAYMLACYLERYRLVVKNQCFMHENEIRAILRINQSDNLKEEYDWSHGFPRPFITIDFSKAAFRSITVGPLLEKDISKIQTEEFLESRGYRSNGMVRNSKAPIRF